MSDRPRRYVDWAVHGLAALVVVGGLAALLWRPFAPSVGVPDPARWFDEAHLSAVAAYRAPRYPLLLLGLALRVAIPLLAAFTPVGRRVVAALVEWGGARRRPVVAGMAAILAVVVVVDLVILPLNGWLTWYHDRVWGLSTQSLAAWFGDWAARHALEWLLVALAAAGGLWLARRAPRLWAPLAGLAGAAAAAVVVLVAPHVLEPIEHDTEPLPQGPVRAEVERVVAGADLDVADIEVADASQRTTRANAYVSGLGATRRVVLYDTLVEGHPPEHVGIVLAHELAHHRHRDVERGTLAAGAGIVLGAYALQWVLRRRVRAGRQRELGDPQAAVVALAVVVVLLNASAPAVAAMSRQVESAADLAALDLTADPEAYREQSIALARSNLSDPSPPRWARVLWSTHPPAASRIEMGERWPLQWRGPVSPPTLEERRPEPDGS